MFDEDFNDRLALAIEAAVLRYEDRDGFLSDDDLLDIADAYTTDPAITDEEMESNEPLRERPDREALLEALYDACTADYDER